MSEAKHASEVSQHLALRDVSEKEREREKGKKIDLSKVKLTHEQKQNSWMKDTACSQETIVLAEHCPLSLA